MLISASAPGTAGAAAPNPSYPAVYSVTLNPANHVAYVHAAVLRRGHGHRGQRPALRQTVRLGLTDPDSSEVVPRSARFGGDFMLTSQGDLEQIYVYGRRHPVQPPVGPHPVRSVDDTAWATAWHGAFYATDHDGGTMDPIAGTSGRAPRWWR